MKKGLFAFLALIGVSSFSQELKMAQNACALVDICVEAETTYDLSCSVQDLVYHLEKMTGAKFKTVKSPVPGRKVQPSSSQMSRGNRPGYWV